MRLETLAQKGDTAAIRQAIEAASDALQPLLSVMSLIPLESKAMAESTLDAERKTKIQALLQTLYKQLLEADTEAVETLETLQTLLPPSSQLQQLAKCVQDYDFDASLPIIKTIAASFKIELEQDDDRKSE